MTAPNSDVLKGNTRLPSLDVPSANKTTVSPCSSRAMIALAASPVAWRRVRSMKIERCRRAKAETKGQPPTSNLATNETGASADRTGMSSQDV